MIEIVLADDHKVVRKSLKALLNAEEDFVVVGEAGDGLQTILLVDELQPDVLILDLMMPEMNGLEVIRQLVKKKSGTRIVILSMHNSEAYVSEALYTGAKAYVLKEALPDELVLAIREVMAGNCYLSTALSTSALEAYMCASRDVEQNNVKPFK